MINSLVTEFVEFMPEVFHPGILYVSLTYETAQHLCCCGCGRKTVTPFSNGWWTLENEDGVISLSPSIGNWQFPCRSHYFIKKNKVEWA